VAPGGEDGFARRYLQNQRPLGAPSAWQHMGFTRRSAMHFCLAVLRQRQTIAQGTRVVPFGVCVVFFTVDDTLSMELVEDIPGVVAQNGG